MKSLPCIDTLCSYLCVYVRERERERPLRQLRDDPRSHIFRGSAANGDNSNSSLSNKVNIILGKYMCVTAFRKILHVQRVSPWRRTMRSCTRWTVSQQICSDVQKVVASPRKINLSPRWKCEKIPQLKIVTFCLLNSSGFSKKFVPYRHILKSCNYANNFHVFFIRQLTRCK
jgi:hypothetical protein